MILFCGYIYFFIIPTINHYFGSWCSYYSYLHSAVCWIVILWSLPAAQGYAPDFCFVNSIPLLETPFLATFPRRQSISKQNCFAMVTSTSQWMLTGQLCCITALYSNVEGHFIGQHSFTCYFGMLKHSLSFYRIGVEMRPYLFVNLSQSWQYLWHWTLVAIVLQSWVCFLSLRIYLRRVSHQSLQHIPFTWGWNNLSFYHITVSENIRISKGRLCSFHPRSEKNELVTSSTIAR